MLVGNNRFKTFGQNPVKFNNQSFQMVQDRPSFKDIPVDPTPNTPAAPTDPVAPTETMAIPPSRMSQGEYNMYRTMARRANSWGPGRMNNDGQNFRHTPQWSVMAPDRWQEFQRYEIQNNPQKRNIYKQFGMGGLKSALFTGQGFGGGNGGPPVTPSGPGPSVPGNLPANVMPSAGFGFTGQVPNGGKLPGTVSPQELNNYRSQALFGSGPGFGPTRF